MPELSIDLPSFQTGDIIVTQRNPMSPVFHTTIFLEPVHSPLHVPSFAHAGQDVTEVLPATAYKSDIPPPHRRYVFADRGLAVATANVATIWSQKHIATRYGDAPSSRNFPIPSGTNANRYSGMQAPANHAAIPFEASALLRLLKWVQRSHEGRCLSENRGI
ncbi:MAG: hypothetical protein JSS56_11075, partial [Proteobacteria bacterium]|nr:hypothetical protein [Pseudomonadota bacterium]